MIVEFYINKNGRSQVLDYIDSFQKQEKAKILACLKTIEDMGFDTPRVEFRQIQGKLWEVKIRTSNQHRIFYTMIKGNKFILLHAYKKETQKAPKKEIEIAEKRMGEIIKNEKD